MRRSLFVLAVVAAITIGASSIAISGGGGTLSVSPASVSPGQSVTISGTQCPPGQSPEGLGSVSWSINGPQPSDTQIANGTVMETSGSWSTGAITIPAGTPPGTYHANATCFYNQPVANSPSRGYSSFNAQYAYSPAPFQVVTPSPTPTTPAPTPSPTTEEDEPDEKPEALPAEAVQGQPTFTG